jgi:hypothetical protein
MYLEVNTTIMPQPLFCYLFTCSAPGNTRHAGRYYIINDDVQFTHDTSPAGVQDPAWAHRTVHLSTTHNCWRTRWEGQAGSPAELSRPAGAARDLAAPVRGGGIAAVAGRRWPAGAGQGRDWSGAGPVEHEPDVPGGGRSSGHYQVPRIVTARAEPVGSALPIFQASIPICG